VPEFFSADDRKNTITLRMLLAHSSGLPAHEKFYLQAKTKSEFLHAVLTTPLAAAPDTMVAYSDIGFIILGTALERLADATLDEFCQTEFATLGMNKTGFNPPVPLRSLIPPTA